MAKKKSRNKSSFLIERELHEMDRRRSEAIQLRANGLDFHTIAKKLSVNDHTVRQWITEEENKEK